MILLINGILLVAAVALFTLFRELEEQEALVVVELLQIQKLLGLRE
jgi:hypothetical protein